MAQYVTGPVNAPGAVAELAVGNDNSGNLLAVANADVSATTLSLAKQVADTPTRVGTLGVSQGLTAGGLVKSGNVVGLSGAAAGVVQSVIAFGAAFPAGLDNVELTIRTPSVQTIGMSAPWTTAEGAGGFTINVNITAAVAASTFDVGWVAYGH